MNFLILTVILAIVQTAAPIPRQAPDSPTATSPDNKNQSQNDKAPPDAPSLINNQEQTDTANRHGNQQTTENTPNTISIRELPPVLIMKDWTDRFYWAFSGLLVVVGGFQVWLLVKQLKTISRQTAIAANQEKQMIAAGEQTERIITQMKDTAIRELRAYVGVSNAKLDISDESLPTGAVEIQNFGRTPAYKVRHWTGICPQSYPLTVSLPPSTAAVSSVAVLHPNVKNTGAVVLKKSLPSGISIGTPQLTIYVYGEITYEDAFGNERHTKFRFFYGGLEPTYAFREPPKTAIYGAMRTDTEGNEAD